MNDKMYERLYMYEDHESYYFYDDIWKALKQSKYRMTEDEVDAAIQKGLLPADVRTVRRSKTEDGTYQYNNYSSDELEDRGIHVVLQQKNLWKFQFPFTVYLTNWHLIFMSCEMRDNPDDVSIFPLKDIESCKVYMCLPEFTTTTGEPVATTSGPSTAKGAVVGGILGGAVGAVIGAEINRSKQTTTIQTPTKITQHNSFNLYINFGDEEITIENWCYALENDVEMLSHALDNLKQNDKAKQLIEKAHKYPSESEMLKVMEDERKELEEKLEAQRKAEKRKRKIIGLFLIGVIIFTVINVIFIYLHRS